MKSVEKIFNNSKSVLSDCITGIKNGLFSGIIAGFHSGVLSLLILPVELEFKIRKCNLLLRLLHFVQ
jgi:TctA family transporter